MADNKSLFARVVTAMLVAVAGFVTGAQAQEQTATGERGVKPNKGVPFDTRIKRSTPQQEPSEVAVKPEQQWDPLDPIVQKKVEYPETNAHVNTAKGGKRSLMLKMTKKSPVHGK